MSAAPPSKLSDAERKARRVAFLRRVKGWWEHTCRPTRAQALARRDDFFVATCAAIVAAAVTVRKELADNPLLAFGTAISAAATALAVFLALVFLVNLIRAPKRLRRDMVAAPGEFFFADLRMNVKMRETDVMQREATFIATAIDNYRQTTARPGRVPQPSDFKQVTDAIERFGTRAEGDEWITWRSRRRSLALFREISATGDLEVIRQKCLDFQQLKPRH